MARDWESSFQSWATGPGTTEEERCENAIRAIRKAVDASDSLSQRNVDVFLQGSYRNRVNVRRDSDVDVGVLCHNTFFYALPDGYGAEDFSISPATYHFDEFKNDLQRALEKQFGHQSVHRGNKAFDIKENTYRVEADVAPFFDHRRYSPEGRYEQGVELKTDGGARVMNWPEQHYSNGVSKNTDTQRRYKRLVRITKRLCIEMGDQGVSVAKSIPGFLLECLVWNVPNYLMVKNTYFEDVRGALIFLYDYTKSEESCWEWGEVSELKYLFRTTQPWTREQAHAFIGAAAIYLGL